VRPALCRAARSESSVFSGPLSRRRLLAIGASALVAVALVILVWRARGIAELPQIPFSEFLQDLDGGTVAEIVVIGDQLEAKLVDGRVTKTVAPANYVTSTSFVPAIMEKGVRMEVRSTSEQTAFSYGALAIGIGFVGLLAFTLYRVTTGRIPTLESKTREADPETTGVTFADVAGVDEAKEEVREIVDFLR